jgi:hypothetical protein
MKKFFAKIMAVLANLLGKLAPELKSAVHTSVVVTEAFKNFVDSPLADLFTVLMPGIKDDQIKVLLRQRLPGILMIMRLIESATLLDNEADTIAAAQRYVGELSAAERKPILHELAVRLAIILSDGKITWSEAVQLVEYYYQNQFKPNELKLAA